MKNELGVKAIEILQEIVDIVNSGSELIIQGDVGRNSLTIFCCENAFNENERRVYKHFYIRDRSTNFEELIHKLHSRVKKWSK